MLLFIRQELTRFGGELAFQYILCYCLSLVFNIADTPYSMFQYILCYCLSNAFPSLLFLSYHTSPYFTRLFSFFTSRSTIFSYSITFLYFQGFYVFFHFSAGNFILYVSCFLNYVTLSFTPLYPIHIYKMPHTTDCISS